MVGQLILKADKALQSCKYFSYIYLLCNKLVVSVLQNLLFYVPKAAVLHGKSGSFTTQNLRFRNAKSKLPFFFGIIFTKQELFLGFAFGKKQEIELHNILMLNLMFVFFLKCGKLHFRTFYVGYT